MLVFLLLQDRSLQILISYKAQSVHPAHVGWLVNLHDLMEKYFRYRYYRVQFLSLMQMGLSHGRFLPEVPLSQPLCYVLSPPGNEVAVELHLHVYRALSK